MPRLSDEELQTLREEFPDENEDIEESLGSSSIPETTLESEKRPRKRKAPAKEEYAPEEIKVVHSKLAKELAEIAGGACGIMGWVTKHDHWYLDDKEAKELGEALADGIPHLPVKKAKAISKKVPLIRLAFAVGLIFGPRVLTEIEIFRQNKFIAQQNKNNAGVGSSVESQHSTNGVMKEGRVINQDGSISTIKFDIPGINEA